MLGDQIRMLMRFRGITHEELADRLGVSIPTIGNYVNNRHRPSKRNMLKMAEIFDIELGFVPKGEVSAIPLPDVPLADMLSRKIASVSALRVEDVRVLESLLLALTEAFVQAIKDKEVGK